MKILLFVLILLSVSGFTNLSAQKADKRITITGYVKDKYQTPVANAWIMVDDRLVGLPTDRNGYYKVKTKTSARTIRVLISTSGILEEDIDGRSRINFIFENYVPFQPNSQELLAHEEEINVGYGKVKRRFLSEHVNKIDGADKKYSSYNSVYDMLRHVPGIRIINKKIQIQNPGSLRMDTEPLLVIDGTVVNSIDNIIPQWVRSVEILKGASAAIYGGRSTNGVILFTLKR